MNEQLEQLEAIKANLLDLISTGEHNDLISVCNIIDTKIEKYREIGKMGTMQIYEMLTNRYAGNPKVVISFYKTQSYYRVYADYEGKTHCPIIYEFETHLSAGEKVGQTIAAIDKEAVSYTHLTLPTSLRV